MGHILETFFFFFMFAQVFVGRWDGISRCFHGDNGNVSGSREFRPGKVLTDKQNEKVSSLASAIPCLFSPLNRLLLSPILSSVCFCSPPSSIFPPLHLLNTSPCYLYLRLQMPSLSSSIILHLFNFSLVLLLCSVFDIYFHPVLASHLLEPHLSSYFPFLSFHSTFASFGGYYLS